jgi:hypothetical protein
VYETTKLSAVVCDTSNRDLPALAKRTDKPRDFSGSSQRGWVGVYLASAVRVSASGAGGGSMDVDRVTQRVRAEFEEMPGMTLTVLQASRLFGIECEICKTVVDRLVTTSYLKWTQAGAVTRSTR